MAFDAAAFDVQHNVPPVGRPDLPFDPGARAPGPPPEDSVVAEVHAAREALFAGAGRDVDELFRRLQAGRAAAGDAGVVRAPHTR